MRQYASHRDCRAAVVFVVDTRSPHDGASQVECSNVDDAIRHLCACTPTGGITVPMSRQGRSDTGPSGHWRKVFGSN